jgi:death-on-curing protein
MTRYLSISETITIYERVMAQSGGMVGIRNLDGLHAAVAQPQMTFDGRELYPTIADKAAALGYSLIQNHPFVDGNKRIGHAAMEIFLILNGYELRAPVDEQETLILNIASGMVRRETLATWIQNHIIPFE